MPKAFAFSVRSVLCAGLLACGAAGAQQVTISRDSQLMSEAKADASVVGQLKQGSSAQVVGKQGAWVNVKSDAGTGWIYSFNVSYGAGSGGPPSSSPTPKRSATTATIGIRGLEKEDLKNATFDGKQLDVLDSFAK